MPYVSKREREKQQRAAEEQKERALFSHLTEAVKRVQEKEGCPDRSAAEQLITAVVDQRLGARWDDEGVLVEVTPGELSGVLKVCLDGVGFVKRNDAATELKPFSRTTDEYPKIEFVDGPVVDLDDHDASYGEINTFRYIPLLISKDDLDRWPLDDFTADTTRKRKQNDLKQSSAKERAVRQKMREIFQERKRKNEKPPNIVEVRKAFVVAKFNVPRSLVDRIYKEDDFVKLKPGQRWRGYDNLSAGPTSPDSE